MRNLSDRTAIEITLPEFVVAALERRLAESRAGGIAESDPHDLSELIEWELVDSITVQDVAKFEKDMPGFAAAVSGGSTAKDPECSLRATYRTNRTRGWPPIVPAFYKQMPVRRMPLPDVSKPSLQRSTFERLTGANIEVICLALEADAEMRRWVLQREDLDFQTIDHCELLLVE